MGQQAHRFSVKGGESCCAPARPARSGARSPATDVQVRTPRHLASPDARAESGRPAAAWYRSGMAKHGNGAPGAVAPAGLAAASVSPPPLLDGIVRVKVPPDKIQPFLAKTGLFKSAPKEAISKAAALFDGLECAEGSELVTAGKVNDGLGILFSGKAQVLLPSAGGELLTVEEIGPGDHFGEASALLGKPSPTFVIASEPSRILWLTAAIFQGLIGNVAAVGEAVVPHLPARADPKPAGGEDTAPAGPG